MDKMNVVEVRGIRVLTTQQIAKAYGVTKDKVIYNFNYNKSRYIKGKHYIEVVGDELRELKRTYENQISFKYAKSLYLWTEKGALLHAKSINTDKAWEVYDYLVDHYFRSEEIMKKQAYEELCRQQASENSQMVVNVPENVEIQNALREVHRYLIAVDVALDEVSKYRSEEEHKRECDRLMLLLTKFYNKTYDALAIKPKLVKKIL